MSLWQKCSYHCPPYNNSQLWSESRGCETLNRGMQHRTRYLNQTHLHPRRNMIDFFPTTVHEIPGHRNTRDVRNCTNLQSTTLLGCCDKTPGAERCRGLITVAFWTWEQFAHKTGNCNENRQRMDNRPTTNYLTRGKPSNLPTLQSEILSILSGRDQKERYKKYGNSWCNLGKKTQPQGHILAHFVGFAIYLHPFPKRILTFPKD